MIAASLLHLSSGQRPAWRCASLTLLALAAFPAMGAEESPTTVPAPATARGQPDITIYAGALDAARNGLSPSLGASTYELGPRQVAAQAQGVEAPFNQTLLRAPGVAQDSFGQVHLRGEHANLQYRINDVLLPEGISGFASELDTRFARQVTLITGALPAQYGFRTAGVIDIETNSGALAPGGQLSLYGGSNGTIHAAAEYGGGSGALDAYATVNAEHSALGIENPTDERTALHDDTNQLRGFGYASYYLDPDSRLSVIASVADSRFEIPNNPEQEPAFTLTGVAPPASRDLDERQRESNSYGVVAYEWARDTGAIQLAGFVRRSALRFTPDHDGDLIYNGVASSADLSTCSAGGQFDGSVRLSDQHTLRGGASLLVQRARSATSTWVFPVDSTGAQTSSDPTLVQDDQAKTGSFAGVYVQDEWRVTARWTINGGVRWDQVAAYVHEHQLSPRLASTIQLSASTAVHVGYARYFTPPPLESMPQETIAKFDGTTNAAPTAQNDAVRSERANYFSAGVTQRLAETWQVGLDGYYKRAQHQLDEGQFGSAVIFTPFNYAEGTVYGVELSATHQDESWLTYANLALSRATGRDIESAQFNFDPDELAYIHDHTVHLDHDQRWTASAGCSYAIVPALHIGVDALFGSGLRKGFANEDQVPAYCTINPNVTYAVGGFSARLDVLNLFDRSYELRDGSGIGVGAPQYGERRGIYGGVTYSF